MLSSKAIPINYLSLGFRYLNFCADVFYTYSLNPTNH